MTLEVTWLDLYVVHPYKFWLGASLDAWVTDPSIPDEQGIVEFQYPYSKTFVHPHKAFKDTDFHCSIIDGIVRLNTFILSQNSIRVICFMQPFKNGVICVCISHAVLPLKGLSKPGSQVGSSFLY